MRLYLVRHGEAVSGPVDQKRPLNHHGAEEVKKVARFLKEGSAKPGVIYHSTKARACQTAEILREVLKVKAALVEKDGLSPNDPVSKIANFIDQQKSDLMIVGHMPFLGSLVSLLVAGEGNKNLVAFPTGGVVILEKEHGQGWLIKNLINPGMLLS